MGGLAWVPWAWGVRRVGGAYRTHLQAPEGSRCGAGIQRVSIYSEPAGCPEPCCPWC